LSIYKVFQESFLYVKQVLSSNSTFSDIFRLVTWIFCIIFVSTIIKAASALSDRYFGEVWLRGKLLSIEQERQLRKLVAEGVGIAEISRVMGKTRVSVRSKMYHLGLSEVDAAAISPTPLLYQLHQLHQLHQLLKPLSTLHPN
jgi:hypothetical protein